MSFTIDHLFNHPTAIPTVTAWIYKEFWADQPGYSPAYFAVLLRQANQPDRIPVSLVALVDQSPVGTINLIDNDDPKRPHLHPWLAALVVAPPYRRQGVGTALVTALATQAQRMGYAHLFLGTDQPDFYTRFGAQHFEQASPTLCIMRLATAPLAPTIRDPAPRPNP